MALRTDGRFPYNVANGYGAYGFFSGDGPQYQAPSLITIPNPPAGVCSMTISDNTYDRASLAAGSYTINIQTVGATAVLNPSCSGAVLPITSTLPAESAPGQTTPAAALLLIALIFGVSGALTMRRFASTNS